MSPRPRTLLFGQKLSPREEKIMSGVSRGKTNKSIAEGLGISEQTAKNHLQTIFIKLGAANRAEATRVYLIRNEGSQLPLRVDREKEPEVSCTVKAIAGIACPQCKNSTECTLWNLFREEQVSRLGGERGNNWEGEKKALGSYVGTAPVLVSSGKS